MKCPRCRNNEKYMNIMDGALMLAAELGEALRPLLPDPETLDPETRAKWQKVVDVIFKSADYADKHDLKQWGGKISQAN